MDDREAAGREAGSATEAAQAAADPGEPIRYEVEVHLGDGGRFQGGRLELDRFGLDLTALRLDDEAHGKKLYQALLASESIQKAYHQAIGSVRSHRSPYVGLRVRLAIDERAPALHGLAWERLYHEHENAWGPLATSARTPLSRYVALQGAHPPPPPEGPVQLLCAVANPAGAEGALTPIDVDAELDNLCAALAGIDRDRLGQIMVMPGRTGLSDARRAALAEAGVEIVDGPTSIENLIARLERGVHALHFIGHGHFDPSSQTAWLHLEDARGGWARVPDRELEGKLLGLREPPRLVFLSACKSAARSDVDAFVGLAPKLVRAHVPAVVAMQDRVRMDHAQTLARHFYTNLFEHGVVDLALNQARNHLHKHQTASERPSARRETRPGCSRRGFPSAHRRPRLRPVCLTPLFVWSGHRIAFEQRIERFSAS